METIDVAIRFARAFLFDGKERIVPTKYTHINLIAIFLAKGDVAIKEIDISGTKNASEAKEIIKSVIDGE